MRTNGSARSPVSRRLARFALLWSGCLAVILLIAGAEAIVLWQRGYTYSSKSSLRGSWIADLSIDRQGKLAAGLATYMQNGNNGSWNDVLLIDLDRRETQKLEIRHLKPECVAMAPGAESMAVASQDGSIYAVTGPTSGGEPPRHRLVGQTGNDQILRLSFSPDGCVLGAVGAKFVWIWEWPSGKLLQRYVHSAISRGFLTFSPDSQWLVSPRESGVCLTALTSGDRPLKIDVGGTPVSRALPDFNLKLAAFVSYDAVSVRDFDGTLLWEEPFPAPVAALDPQKKIMAVASAENNYSVIALRDFATGQPIGQLAGKNALVGGLAFSPKGVLYGWDFHGGLHAWNVTDSRMLWSMTPAQQSDSRADLASKLSSGASMRGSGPALSGPALSRPALSGPALFGRAAVRLSASTGFTGD